jgi:hypothetical protein
MRVGTNNELPAYTASYSRMYCIFKMKLYKKLKKTFGEVLENK